MTAEAPAIEFENVAFAYPGSAPAIENISLRVEPGERLGLLGPNGGGKTTLLKIAMGLLTGYSGEVRVFGQDPRRARRAGLIGAVPQKPTIETAFPLSAKQAVALAAEKKLPAWRRASKETRNRVRLAMELVGVETFADKPIGALSGGQLQRVLIARAAASAPRILALDEPTVGVDPEGQARFAEMLDRLHRELNLTMVIVSHDVRAVAAACDRAACLARRIHFHAAPEGLTPQVLAEVFRHDVAGVFGDVHVEAHAAEECPGEQAHPSLQSEPGDQSTRSEETGGARRAHD